MTTIHFEPDELVVQTTGKGLYSPVVRDLDVEKIEVVESGKEEFLFVYIRNWKNSEDGLVYTDPGFLKNLKSSLKPRVKMPDRDWRKLNYTEQGMQGGHMNKCGEDCTKCKEYVHLILGKW